MRSNAPTIPPSNRDIIEHMDAMRAEILETFRAEMNAMRTELREEFRSEVTGLRSEVTGLGSELTQFRSEMAEFRSEFVQFRSETRSDIELLAVHLNNAHNDIKDLKTRVGGVERDMAIALPLMKGLAFDAADVKTEVIAIRRELAADRSTRT